MAGRPSLPAGTSRVAAAALCACLLFGGATLSAGAAARVAEDSTSVEAAAPDGGATPDPFAAPAADQSSTAAPDQSAPSESSPAQSDPAQSSTQSDAAPATTDAAPAAAPAPDAAAPDTTDSSPAASGDALRPAAPAASTQPSAPASPHRTTTRRVVPRRATPSSRATAVRPAAVPLPLFPVVPFDLRLWRHDNPASPVGAAAVAIAEHYLGVPYVWAGATPGSGFDCSGLTQFVYAQLGIWLPHYAAAQFASLPHVDSTQLAPGDLVFFEPKADGPGHVAIYAGGDTIVEAPHTGAAVRISSFSREAAALGFLGAARPYSTAAPAPAPAAFGLGVFRAVIPD